MRECMEFTVFLILMSCIVILIVFLPSLAIDSYHCKSYGEVTGAETKYAGLTCYTKHEELGWLSLNEWNKVKVAERHQLEIKEVK